MTLRRRPANIFAASCSRTVKAGRGGGELAKAHLDEVRVKLSEMYELDASLDAFLSSCDTGCRGGMIRDCMIIVDLSMPVVDIASTGVSCRAVPAKAGAAFTTTELKRK